MTGQKTEQMSGHVTGSSWAVVGGGMAGIGVALGLADAGRAVTLYEASPTLGGLAAPWRVGPVSWDRYYHVVLRGDTRTLALLDRVGLGEAVQWRPTSAALYDGHALHPIGGLVDSLRLPGVSVVTKARVGLNLAVGLAHRRADLVDRIPVDRWVRRWSGRQGYEQIWAPLLRAKLGGDASDVSATLLWATIHRLASARRGGVGQEELGHLPGGARELLERLRDALAEAGVDVRCSTPVERVEQTSGEVAVRLAGGATVHHDGLVLTVAAPLAARLCPQLGADECARLEQVTYRGVVCASLVLRRSLSGRYLTYLTDPDTPFTAVVEMSALTGADALGGHHLVYLPRYVRPDDPLLRAGDDEVRDAFLPYLRRIHPDLADGDVVAFAVARTPTVFAVPAPGGRRRPVPVRTSLPGVHLVGSAHITDGTLNVNETLTTVERALPIVLAADQRAVTPPARPAEVGA